MKAYQLFAIFAVLGWLLLFNNTTSPSCAQTTQSVVFCAPSTGTITQGYSSNHTGIDISGQSGTAQGPAVFAPADGIIAYVGMAELVGDNPNQINHAVAINHGLVNGKYTLSFLVHLGDQNTTYILDTIRPGIAVQRGQVIGYQGTAGLATGTHVHWEMRTYNQPFQNNYATWGIRCDTSDIWWEFGGGGNCSNPNPPMIVSPEDFVGSLPVGTTAPDCVRDNILPTGGYTEPANMAVVGSLITLRGTATDNVGVQYVNFTAYYNSAWHLINTDYNAPYEYNWDISGISDQNITLGYDIYDLSGNVAYAPEGTRTIIKDTQASNDQVSCIVTQGVRLDCFLQGANNHMYQKYWDGTTWQGWFDLAGNLASAPTCFLSSPGVINCFARGADSHMYQRYWDGTTWQGWFDLGSHLVVSPINHKVFLPMLRR